MVWLVLVLAGIFEVAWVFALKASDGMTRILPASLAAFFAFVSIALLAVAIKQQVAACCSTEPDGDSSDQRVIIKV